MTTSSVSATSPFAEFVGTLALIGLAALLAAGWALARALRDELEQRRRERAEAERIARTVTAQRVRDHQRQIVSDLFPPTPTDNRRAS